MSHASNYAASTREITESILAGHLRKLQGEVASAIAALESGQNQPGGTDLSGLAVRIEQGFAERALLARFEIVGAKDDEKLDAMADRIRRG